MSSAKKRINSTGRKRIPLELLDIRMLSSKAGEPLRATATLKLESTPYPPSANVIVEAYRSSTGMRFACGTIGSLSVPPVLTLSEIDHGGNVLFRVKVVDTQDEPGRLIASAERIQPRSEDDKDGRKSLFPIIERDLGDLIWLVDMELDSSPTLVLNSSIPGFKLRILESPILQGILLPAALRIVIQKLAADPSTDETDEAEWREDWLSFCREELGIKDDPSDLTGASSTEWVDDVVSRFCESKNFVGRIKSYIEEDA